ncbi:MAG: DUF2177 family protein [Desulforhopalus sp.]
MTILPTVLTVLVMYISLMLFDYIWLGIVCRKFIISEFGSLVNVVDGSIRINLTAGLLAWFFIALGCFIFAVNPAESLSGALLSGAVFGCLVYAIYDLTNLTFIVGYPLKFIFVDIAWGTVLCGIISGIGFFVRTTIGT